MANFSRTWIAHTEDDTFALSKTDAPKLTNAANQGWSASMTTSFMPPSPIRFEMAQKDLGTGEVVRLLSPWMRLLGGTKTARKGQNATRGNVAWATTWQDVPMLALAPPGQSFPTFQSSSSTAIAAAIAAWAGVEIVDLDNWEVPLEEIKQQKPLDAFRRLLAAAGQDFQILPSTGKIKCYRSTANLGKCSRQIVVPGYNEGLGDPLRRVTGLRVERQASLSGDQVKRFDTSDFYSWQLDAPLANAIAEDISSSGYIGEVGFWNGDPRQDGKLIRFISFLTIDSLSIPTNGNWPATHASLNVYKSVIGTVTGEEVDAAVRIVGTPWAATTGQQKPGFSVMLGDGSWPAEQPWVEPLIPDAAFAQAREKDYLWQRNKGEFPVSGGFSRWVLDAAPGQWLKPRIFGEDWSKMRIDAVSHGWSNTTVTGNVITYE